MRRISLISIMILCGICASSPDDWISSESMQTDALGSDGMCVKSELNTNLMINDYVARKNVEAKSYASDIRKIAMAIN